MKNMKHLECTVCLRVSINVIQASIQIQQETEGTVLFITAYIFMSVDYLFHHQIIFNYKQGSGFSA